MTPSLPLRIGGIVGAVLDRLGIRYVIGGSVASSLYAMKVDFFFAEDDAAVREQLDRRQRIEESGHIVYVYSREDILVRKLAWYRLGGETSERQRRDIAGLLQAGSRELDRAYLARAAAHFNVSDLLERALRA